MAESSPTNSLGLTLKDYEGAKSTLCLGCGHDSITSAIVQALHGASVDPYSVAKMSGIGCSSKTPAYFLGRSHGFNTIHGRMAPVATGVKLANHRLRAIGVSGDGDTASIGLGGWAHLIRRNLPMVYIVENNGVYGLTKGQFSATADEGTTQKSGEENPFVTIDLCSLAIELGCGFVARAFSGDRRQLVAILQAAFHYRGLAIIDVVSPCVTFANHDGSTKSFSYVKTHQHSLQEIGFVPPAQEIRVDYPAGTTQAVSLHDGSQIILRKLDPLAHDVRDAALAYEALTVARRRGEILTGMLFFDEEKPNLLDVLKISDRPLCSLTESDLRPSEAVFASWLRDFY